MGIETAKSANLANWETPSHISMPWLETATTLPITTEASTTFAIPAASSRPCTPWILVRRIANSTTKPNSATAEVEMARLA